jgi:hypothetical protein
MGALGCTQISRGSRRVGSALEWQGGRRVSAHVQPARNFQGVSSAPGSAQHERSVQDVSFASGRRDQLQRLGACREDCRSSEGSDFEGENEGEGCRSPEGSDFAAEEGYEEGDLNAEEGHE